MRAELHPLGVEIVTVGMDTAGAQACRPFIEAARPEHPSLVDVRHRTAELFGVVNVPNGVWIDEDGMIVRPAEPAFPGPRTRLPTGDPARLPARMRQVLAEASRIEADDEAYAAAVRDWARHGAASEFALTPDEVRARSGRDAATAEAAAHFDLAQHLHRAGRVDAAVPHFRRAHRLYPENIAYKRQAWSLATPGEGPFARLLQGPVEGQEWPYDDDWVSEIQRVGAENYYPRMR